jgi:hypothetical protein
MHMPIASTERSPIRESSFDTLMATCEALQQSYVDGCEFVESVEQRRSGKISNVHAQNCGNHSQGTMPQWIECTLEPVPRRSNQE